MTEENYTDAEKGLNVIEDYVTGYTTRHALPEPAENAEEASPRESDWQTRHNEREAEKDAIRQRIRSSNGVNEFFHKGRPAPTIQDKGDKNVAVYARVSTMNTEQISSIENQEKFYTKKISENENWTMQKIYSDEGKSGMDVRHRPEFQQMIADAGKGKMDLILCASVSRFARNIKQCLEYITKLKTMNPRHPVGVYFETENIYTLDPNSTQTLQFHAMLADWESENKSRRMILSYDQRICTGQYPVLDLLGYRHTKDGQLIIQEDEAKTVRFVFLSLVAGSSCEEIAEILTEKQRPTLKGNVVWHGGMVRNITQNERRWGDLEARKTIVVEPREKIITKNNGERDWAFVPGHHEGIVTPEIARAAQFMASSQGMLDNGVPGLNVIDNGALRGFVSVCPRWHGIDSETFLYACQSVYSDAELEQMDREIRIWTGQEESDVLSMSTTGYSIPPGIMFLTNGKPALTITERSVKFNKSCHDRLDNCEWVELLYHPMLQMVVLREGSPDNPNSFRWVSEGGNNVSSVSTKAFSETVYESLKWIREYQFRFRGVTKVRDGAKIIVFSLFEPQILAGKKKPSEVEELTEGEKRTGTRYIPYRTDEVDDREGSAGVAAAAYPKEWEQRKFGIHCLLRKKREEAFSSLTREDICSRGITIDNPKIGSIPSRQEILDELDELLASM